MTKIINVWQSNLINEMKIIRSLLNTYNYVSMDTEFPGVVAKPTGTFQSQPSFIYQQLRCNVDILKLIQLGITLSDANGNFPDPCTWQFNFTFDIENDMYSKESIDLLIKAEIDFKRHKQEGIKIEDFSDLLITSGLVMSKKITWVSFHSAYDFGYLIKLLTCNPLPENENDFFVLLNLLFINFYDMKYLMRGSKYLKKGLQEIADDIGALRAGIQHQAGSDSYLTSLTFFKAKDTFFENDIEKNGNRLFGLENKHETCK